MGRTGVSLLNRLLERQRFETLHVELATRLVVRRAAVVIAVSDYLRRELEAKVPEARGRTEVVSSGVDLERFAPTPPPDGPARFLCVGALTERKNVLRLARAFGRLGDDGATLTFVGDGPHRPRLEGRPGIALAGRVAHDEVGSPALCRRQPGSRQRGRSDRREQGPAGRGPG